MIARSGSRFLALLVLAAVSTSLVPITGRAQTFQYPPYGAVRGRMVSRDGLGHSTRYRWGNGLTPQGAAFLTNAVNVIGPMIPGLVGLGRDLDDQTADAQNRSTAARTPVQFTAPADYVVEQRRANELLERTAALVGFAATPPVSPPGAASIGSLKLSNELTKHPGDPWTEDKEIKK